MTSLTPVFAASNLRDMQKQLLQEMLTLNEIVWKVYKLNHLFILDFDIRRSWTKDIIAIISISWPQRTWSDAAHVKYILLIIRDINTDRQYIAEVPAIYFIEASRSNIERLVKVPWYPANVFYRTFLLDYMNHSLWTL